jgi:hypothetical protein
MFRRLALTCIGVFALPYLLAGCGVRPQVDFYVNPITTGEEQRIDEEAGSVTVEEAGVSITVSAVDAADLLRVTSDVYINPYIHLGDWGIARPLYTVFDVTIKNNRESKVLIDPSSAVLMDQQGEQYDVIPYDAFGERYEAYPGSEREIIYYPPPPYVYYRSAYYRYYRWWPRPWDYRYDWYWGQRPYYARKIYRATYFRRAVARGTLLRSVKLYPGGKRQGFLIFPILAPHAGELTLIMPDITIYHEDKERKIEFQFHFERISAAKG